MTKQIFRRRNAAKMLVTALVAVTLFSACGKDNDKGKSNNGNGNTTQQPGGNNNYGYTGGMPSESVLASFGLSGLTLPAGATNIEHSATPVTLGINFKGYASNDNPFSTVFANNGWNFDEGSSWLEETAGYWKYRKGDDGLTYGWGSLNGSVIAVIKNEYAE
jgi:hypothetical protein